MNTNRRWWAVAMCLAFAGTTAASATPIDITYTATDLAFNVWEYQYTVANNQAIPIPHFTVWFEWGDPSHAVPDYQLMKDVSPPDVTAKWSSLVADPLIPDITDPGYFDEVVILPTDAIPLGGSATEFIVSFVWNGPGTPGRQPFQAYDAAGDVIFSGMTLPEPITCAIMAAGICGVLRLRRTPRRNEL